MPRGRPRKIAVGSTIAQTIHKTITDPIIDIDERVGDIIEETQESDTMAEKGTAAQIMLSKAEAELERLHSKREAIETLIEERQSLRSTLQFQHQKAEAAHREALDAFNSLDHAIGLQRQRTRLSEGTPIHTEMEEALAKLHSEHRSASATLHEAKENLAHTKHALDESDSLLSECDRHQAELEQVTSDIKTMETLRDEWHARRGLELAQMVREAVYDAKDFQRQVLEDSEKRLQVALSLIESELAEEYPELASEIAEAFTEKVTEDSSEGQGNVGEATRVEVREEDDTEEAPVNDPFIKLCYDWMAFLQSLRENGQEVLKRTSSNGITGSQLVERLSLHPGRMLHFMQPSNWRYIREKDLYGIEKNRWSNNDIEIIRRIIADEMVRLRDTGWQYRQRDF